MNVGTLLLCLLHVASALRLAPTAIGRRTALRASFAAVVPLLAARTPPAAALTAYAAKDFRDGVYVGPSTVGAAPTAEGEAELERLYLEAVAKQEKQVAAMGFELDDSDRKEIEMLIRTQYCGFQAKLKCKGSPAAK